MYSLRQDGRHGKSPWPDDWHEPKPSAQTKFVK